MFLCRRLEALPRQRPPAKVHEYVAQGFKVVTPTLLDAEVGIDTGVAGGAGQVFVFAVGNVQVRFWVAVFFGEPKVDDVDLISAFADAHEEVVWFDIAVDK